MRENSIQSSLHRKTIPSIIQHAQYSVHLAVFREAEGGVVPNVVPNSVGGAFSRESAGGSFRRRTGSILGVYNFGHHTRGFDSCDTFVKNRFKFSGTIFGHHIGHHVLFFRAPHSGTTLGTSLGTNFGHHFRAPHFGIAAPLPPRFGGADSS